MKKVFAVTAVVVLLCLGSLAHADLLRATFTGNGSFELNETSYGDSNFTITTIMDTAKRQYSSEYEVYWIENDSAQIVIQGLGTYTFLTATQTFCVIGNGCVGLARGGTESGSDLYDITDIPSSKNWDMLTSFGPVSTTTGALTQWGGQYSNFYTDGGILEFDSIGNVRATFMAEAVPEPSSLLALLAGVGVFAPFIKCRK